MLLIDSRTIYANRLWQSFGVSRCIFKCQPNDTLSLTKTNLSANSPSSRNKIYSFLAHLFFCIKYHSTSRFPQGFVCCLLICHHPLLPLPCYLLLFENHPKQQLSGQPWLASSGLCDNMYQRICHWGLSCSTSPGRWGLPKWHSFFGNWSNTMSGRMSGDHQCLGLPLASWILQLLWSILHLCLHCPGNHALGILHHSRQSWSQPCESGGKNFISDLD